MVHTLKRPLENMKSYVHNVADVELPDQALRERTSRMQRYLNRQEVFADLEIANFGAITAMLRPGGDAITAPCTTRDVLEVLRKVGYDPEVIERDGLAVPQRRTVIHDPLYGQPVNLDWQPAELFVCRPEPLAFIIAELVENAACYVKDALPPNANGRISVKLERRTLGITNEIDPRQADLITRKIDERLASGDGNLARVKHLAEVCGLDFTYVVLASGTVSFCLTITPHESD